MLLFLGVVGSAWPAELQRFFAIWLFDWQAASGKQLSAQQGSAVTARGGSAYAAAIAYRDRFCSDFEARGNSLINRADGNPSEIGQAGCWSTGGKGQACGIAQA